MGSNRYPKVDPSTDALGHPIGPRLRQIRELAGVTQNELSAKMGVGQTALSRLEKRDDVLVSTLQHYLEALGLGLRIEAEKELERGPEIDGVQETHAWLPIIPYGDEAGRSRPKGEGLAKREPEALIVTVDPEPCARILSNEQTVEIRTYVSKRLKSGGFALLYADDPRCALMGFVQIVEVIHAAKSILWEKYGAEASVSQNRFDQQFRGRAAGYAIRFRGAHPLTRPLEVEELFTRFGFDRGHERISAELFTELSPQWATAVG